MARSRKKGSKPYGDSHAPQGGRHARSKISRLHNNRPFFRHKRGLKDSKEPLNLSRISPFAPALRPAPTPVRPQETSELFQDIVRSLELPIFDKESAVQVAPDPGYSPSSMTKSSNKGQTVGEKYSGIEFLPTPGRTLASRSPLEGTPVPRIPTRRYPGPRNGVFRARS
ncbi:hypothetical protein F2Q70_00002702 [Brassica cretica]|uniref:Uncharacterized protein n=1 Tax=Brassica cretica TaxID=69181 RepID=A0A8S9IYV2_BRACR|nr:hypothetical protein F2Q70_00002702 [Brassica cretica]